MHPACPPAALLPIDEPSRVAEARREVAEAARRLGFDETDTGRAALVATELATNLLKHAGGGEILLCANDAVVPSGPATPDVPRSGAAWPATLQLVALDRGPGIPNLEASLRDGFSTVGTAGNGLGAVRRLADRFAAWSGPAASQTVRGTAILAQLFPAGSASTRSGLPQPHRGEPWAGLALAKPGEEACGDSFAALPGPLPGTLLAVMADGLGHGPSAALASAEAIRLFRAAATRAGGANLHTAEFPRGNLHSASQGTSPAALLDALHHGLGHTRGAAIAVALLGDPHPGAVRLAGLGNIAGTLIAPATGQARRLVSMAGIAGNLAARHRAREFQAENGTDALLVLHSDGVATSWSLAEYPGLTAQPPALVAAVLLRDHARRDNFGRRSDDAAVLVARAPVPAANEAAAA